MIIYFKQLNFKELITQKEFMMKNIFYDIFRALLMGLNRQPPVFLVELMLEYLEVSYSITKKEEIDSLIRNTAHILKSIDQTPENGFFFERLLNIIISISPKLTKIIDEDTTETYLEIVEEFIIIGVNPQAFDYIGYLRKLYETLSETENGKIELTTSFKIKSSILSIYTSILLLDLEKNRFNFGNFENCATTILSELFRNNQHSTVKYFLNLKTQVVSLLNRFLIIEFV